MPLNLPGPGPGIFYHVPPSGADTPPVPVIIDTENRARWRALAEIIAVRGFVDPGPAANAPVPPAFLLEAHDNRRRVWEPVVIAGSQFEAQGGFVAPPPWWVVQQPDDRRRYQPGDTIVFASGLAAATIRPVPPPFIVPIDDRRRLLVPTPTVFTVGFDTVGPPAPFILDADGRRRPTAGDPVWTSSALAASVIPPSVLPPGAFILDRDERGRYLVAIPALGQHGFVDPGAAANSPVPPLVIVERVDHRLGYRPYELVMFPSGLVSASIPIVPVVVNAGTDWAPVIASW